LKLKQQLADKRGEAIAHIIAACISLEKCIYSDVSLSEKLRKNMLKTSIERLNKSVAICNEIQEKWLLAINYHLLTEAYTKMHDYKNALKTSEKALKLAKEVTAADIEAECYRSIAVLDCALKKWSRAKTNFEKCIKMLSRLNEKVELGKTFYEYALLFKNKNDTKSCIKYLMKAAKIFKEVGATKKLKHINKMYQEEMCQKGV
jgi:tetratricopeptide (TPR) repeat protein